MAQPSAKRKAIEANDFEDRMRVTARAIVKTEPSDEDYSIHDKWLRDTPSHREYNGKVPPLHVTQAPTHLTVCLHVLDVYPSDHRLHLGTFEEIVQQASNSSQDAQACINALQERRLGPQKLEPLIIAITEVIACHKAAALASTITTAEALRKLLAAFIRGLPSSSNVLGFFSSSSRVAWVAWVAWERTVSHGPQGRSQTSSSTCDHQPASHDLAIASSGRRSYRPPSPDTSRRFTFEITGASQNAAAQLQHDLPPSTQIPFSSTNAKKGDMKLAVYAFSAIDASFNITEEELKTAYTLALGTKHVPRFLRPERLNSQLWAVTCRSDEAAVLALKTSIMLRGLTFLPDPNTPFNTSYPISSCGVRTKRWPSSLPL
ncbi:hypothetical protein LTR15_012704 [Elasticomyces elasticus]|nr:hypothetical protein LTR15_012704 [Elasticomyces elasticus]